MKPRKRIRQYSPRGQTIKDCLDLIRKIMVAERGGPICDFCGREQNNISIFHILNRSTHPRLILYRENLLLACWDTRYYAKRCHNLYHNDPEYTQKRLIPKIKELKGDDYKENLLIAEKMQGKLNPTALNLTKMALAQELETLISTYKERE